MGVEWIEKHFTLCRDFEGKDHFISIDAPQLRELCEYRDYIHLRELQETMDKSAAAKL